MAAGSARKVVRMIDVFNDLDMEKLATFKHEHEASGFDSEITAPFAELTASAPVNQFEPCHPRSNILLHKQS